MSLVQNPDSEDKVLSNLVKEDIKLKFDREVKALGNHLTEANEAAVSRSLRLIVLIPVKEDLLNTHSSMAQQNLRRLLGGNPEYRTATSTKAVTRLRRLFRKAATEVADFENSVLGVLDQKYDEQATAIVAEKENGEDV